MRMKTKKTKLEFLTNKASSAISMFKFAIESLRETNKEIEEEVTVNVEKIKSIETTNISLHNLKSQNERILSNLEGMLQ